MRNIAPSILKLGQFLLEFLHGLPGYPTEDGLAIVLVSPLTSLQLGLRFLAVLYFGEGQTFSARQKEASLGIPRSLLGRYYMGKLS